MNWRVWIAVLLIGMLVITPVLAAEQNSQAGSFWNSGFGNFLNAIRDRIDQWMVKNQIEICDGRDNDRDGQVDEGNPGGGIRCYTGRPGADTQGTTQCQSGRIVCVPNTPPQQEICNGIDDNKNGKVDEGNPGGGQACSTNKPGVCAAGTTQCLNGQITCVQNRQPGPESCNGLDENCNGQIDDGLGSSSCGIGECAKTVDSCANGQPQTCTPGTPAAEVCDGKDNDCNGQVDDGIAPVATTCGVGACQASGQMACTNGALINTCTPGQPTGPDNQCDGIDQNCDGKIDDGYVPIPTSCGLGACKATGSTSCVAGLVKDSCTPGTPSATDATCDGLDNDCNGQADEDYVPTVTSCGVGACVAAGQLSCSNGALSDTCVAGAPTGDDSDCDGVDDNCDGTADNFYVAPATSCGIGACVAAGQLSCSKGALIDTCIPGSPTAEICDGLDNDCDSAADESLGSTTCGLGGCARTVDNCVSGVVQDCVPGAPSAEICDGLDNDCDGVVDNGATSACNDNDPCTNDACNSLMGGCIHTPVTCNDGIACTLESCNALTGQCVSTPDNSACPSDICNVGSCVAGQGCVQTPLDCDDGKPCTLDSCNPLMGGCIHTPVTCNDGIDCTTESCNALTGQCVSTPDNSACPSDTCNVGSCVAGQGCMQTPLDCDDNDPCTNDACNPVLGCVHTPVSCDDGNVCTVDSCNAATGQCQHPAAPSGTACNDGDACTQKDTCNDGSCVGTPVTCDDGNSCTADSCDPSSGCSYRPANSGMACDDGSLCTTRDICNDGTCVGTPVTCDDGNSCTADSCDPSSGCSYRPANSGMACDDGSLCTTRDTCNAGNCVGIPLSCDDGNSCTNDACDPSSGCSYTPANSGMACDDRSLCTTRDICNGGSCGGTPVTCDDGNSCTVDSCDMQTGCQHRDAPTGTVCDDGNVCTMHDTCQSGICVPGAPSAEICDGLDNDCDGTADEGLGATTCGIGACARTVDNCANGVVQICVPGAPTFEVCNGVNHIGLDDDCDGAVNELGVCGLNEGCIDSSLGFICQCLTGFTNCGSGCTALITTTNCGGCGIQCSTNQQCINQGTVSYPKYKCWP